MSRDNLLRALSVVLLIVLVVGTGTWFASVTEWVDVEVRTPPRGEAARNPLYGARRLLQDLGTKIQTKSGLDAMPPANARLLLTSTHWALFPGREARLHQWVERGGHLVLPALLAGDGALSDWVPVDLQEADKRPVIRAPVAPAPRTGASTPAKDKDCRELSDRMAAPLPPDTARSLRLCGWPHWQRMVARTPAVPLWALEGSGGIELLRMAVGKGSVTVLGPHRAFHNTGLLRGDNAVVLAATLQLEPGVEVWIVAEESREHLLLWVWHAAWIAIVLVLAAVLAALWRGAVRFGPVGTTTEQQRRSMAEQVTGTARFLREHGPDALYAAQVRALQESAGRHVPGYRRLAGAARVQALAQATGLAARDLEHVLAPRRRTSAALPAELDLLETARRRLAETYRSPSTHPKEPYATPT